MTLAEFLDAVETKTSCAPYAFRRFGRRLDDDARAAVFERMLVETRREQLLRYLWAFWAFPSSEQTVPRLDGRLFELAESHDEDIQAAAIRVLAGVKDGSVHELGVRLLRDPTKAALVWAIRLFAKNYQPGDHRLIEAALPVEGDSEDVHGMALDIIGVASEQETAELADCLLWVYEHSPCSCCRMSAVEDLIERDYAPRAMLDECLWDCQDETRDLAKAALDKM